MYHKFYEKKYYKHIGKKDVHVFIAQFTEEKTRGRGRGRGRRRRGRGREEGEGGSVSEDECLRDGTAREQGQVIVHESAEASAIMES